MKLMQFKCVSFRRGGVVNSGKSACEGDQRVSFSDSLNQSRAFLKFN